MLAEGRPCCLGGVLFADCPVGPVGHSDGDALVHALIDALLGAAAMGDIGLHFPDTDPTWRGADSMDLLARANAMLHDARWRIVNMDTTVITEKPHLASRIGEMRKAIAGVLGIGEDKVSIKATRGEGVGPEGRGECITVMAVVLIEELGSVEGNP